MPQAPANVDSATTSDATDRGDNLQASEEITVHNTTVDHTRSLVTYTGHTRERPHADPELSPGIHTGDTMDPVQHSDPVLDTCLEENTVS